MSADVFISYASEDRSYVDRLTRHLREAGFSVWYDQKIETGSSWANAIQTQIDTCAVVVVVLTQAAKQSDWVTHEILYAGQKGKRIVPLRLTGEMTLTLAGIQHYDVLDGRMPDGHVLAQIRTLVRPSAHQPAGVPDRLVPQSPDMADGRRASQFLALRRDAIAACTTCDFLADQLRTAATLGWSDDNVLAFRAIGTALQLLSRAFYLAGLPIAFEHDEAIRRFTEQSGVPLNGLYLADLCTATKELRSAIGRITSTEGLNRGWVYNRKRNLVPLSALTMRDRDATKIEESFATARAAVRSARDAAYAFATDVLEIGIDVTGVDLSFADADDRLDGFIWNRATVWPTQVIDDVAARSTAISKGRWVVRPAS